MKTMTFFILAVLFSTVTLGAAKKIENTNERTKIKEYVAFRFTPIDLTRNDDNTMIAEVERKDVSNIVFKINIQQVTESALTTDIDGLNNRKAVSFKLDVKDVVKNIKMDQALYELAVAEVAFKLNIHDVMKTLANTDASILDYETAPIKFALNASDVEKYARSVNDNDLVTEEACLADIQ